MLCGRILISRPDTDRSGADSILGWAGRFSAEVPSSLEAQGTTGAKTEPRSPVSGGILAKVKANRVSIAHAI